MTYQELMQQLAASPYGTYLDYNGQRGKLTFDGTALMLDGGQSVPIMQGSDGSVQFGNAYANDPGMSFGEHTSFIGGSLPQMAKALSPALMATGVAGLQAAGMLGTGATATSAVGGSAGGLNAAGLGGVSAETAASASPLAGTFGSDSGYYASGPQFGGTTEGNPAWMNTPVEPDIPIDPSAGSSSAPITNLTSPATHTLSGTEASKVISPGVWSNTVDAVGNKLPAIAGTTAAIASASGNPTSLTSTSSTSLPAYLQPYAQDYAQRASMFATSPTTKYGGPLGADITGDQNASYQQYRNISNYNNPVNSAGSTALLDTINGRYLNPQSNPYLQQTYDLAANRMADAYARGTGASTNAAFGSSGSFGGSAHQEMVQANNRAFGDSLANLGNQIFGGNYQAERARQDNASQFAPTMANQQQDYMLKGADALNRAGTQQYDANLTNNKMNYAEFIRQQEDQYNKLGAYKSIFDGMGQNTTQTQPGVSRTNSLLGSTATGAYIYNLLK